MGTLPLCEGCLFYFQSIQTYSVGLERAASYERGTQSYKRGTRSYERGTRSTGAAREV